MATLAVRDADNVVRYLDVTGSGSSGDPFVPHQRVDQVMLDSFVTHQVTLTTAGQIVQLPVYAPQHGVLLKALSTNNGQIFLGGPSVSNTNGFELDKGQSILVRIDELSKLYVTATAANEGVCLFVI